MLAQLHLSSTALDQRMMHMHLHTEVLGRLGLITYCELPPKKKSLSGLSATHQTDVQHFIIHISCGGPWILKHGAIVCVCIPPMNALEKVPEDQFTMERLILCQFLSQCINCKTVVLIVLFFLVCILSSICGEWGFEKTTTFLQYLIICGCEVCNCGLGFCYKTHQ